MAVAWVPVHRTLFSHAKLFRLARTLSVDPHAAAGHLIRFWLWTSDNREDGRLEDLPVLTLAQAAGWTGDAQRFRDALVEVGWLDAEPLRVHDWEDYAAPLLEQRLANRNRARRYRQRRLEALRNGDGNVTLYLASRVTSRENVTGIGTGTGTGIETGTRTARVKGLPTVVGPPSPSVRPDPAPRRWRRVPAGEELTAERRAIAKRYGVDAAEEWEAFLNHDFEKPKTRVTATWSNWCRTARDRQARPGVGPRGGGRRPPAPNYEHVDYREED